MTTENYVNAIVKQLKCSRRKRKEIKQQLLSDIAAAIENGETAAAIMARMGYAKEAAAEFNQNLSPTEQKHFSRSRKIKAVSSIIIADSVPSAAGMVSSSSAPAWMSAAPAGAVSPPAGVSCRITACASPAVSA